MLLSQWHATSSNTAVCCKINICECVLVRKAVLSGMSAGAMAQYIASPTDLVKVQMQMEGRRRLDGKPPR